MRKFIFVLLAFAGMTSSGLLHAEERLLRCTLQDPCQKREALDYCIAGIGIRQTGPQTALVIVHRFIPEGPVHLRALSDEGATFIEESSTGLHVGWDNGLSFLELVEDEGATAERRFTGFGRLQHFAIDHVRCVEASPR